ncbi:MAG: HAD-IIA family hydrolase [Candidatus Poseidoniales archaeon]
MNGQLDVSLDKIRCVFLDLDGTIYLGGKLINGAIEFLQRLDEKKIQYFFLSNNSSKSVRQYVKKLENMGISAKKSDILLSTHDLISWLKSKNVSRSYLVGTEGMREMLESEGIGTKSDNPEYVIIGYDTEINYEKLSKASFHLHNGVKLVASHPDIVCPSPLGGLPDSGAYMALFEATTGVRPSHICGKPNPGMILHKIIELGFAPEECAMIGDRIYTDMEMAIRSNVNGILVLSGEATKEDLGKISKQPELVVSSVDELVR